MQFSNQNELQAHELRLAVTALLNLAHSLGIEIPLPETEESRQLQEFVKAIARLQKDGEPYPDDPEMGEFDMTNDDAYDTLHGLISRAREIVYGRTE